MENAILQLYEQVEMYKISTPKYQELLRNFNDARDKFDKKLNDEEKETLENVISLLSRADEQEMEEYFVERIYTRSKTYDRDIIQRRYINRHTRNIYKGIPCIS